MTAPGSSTPSPATPPTIGRVVRGVIASYTEHPALFVAVVLAMAYQVAFNLFISLASRHLFDRILPSRDGVALATLGGVLAATLLIRVGVALGQERGMADLAARSMASLRARMFSQLQKQPAAYFARTPAPEILGRFTTDLAAVEMAMNRLVPRILFLTLNILGCTVLMFVLDVRLATAVAVALWLAFLLPRRLGARAAQMTSKRRQAEGGVLGVIQESVALHSVVRAFRLERWVRTTHDEKIAEFKNKARSAVFAGSAVETSTVLSFAAVQALVLTVGAWLVIAGGLSPGVLVAFTALVGTVSSSMFGVSAVLPPLIESASGRARIEHLLQDLPETKGAIELPRLEKGIRFDGVTFSYTGERRDLADVSFEIPAGSSVAFVGPSGSGKSTVLSILTRTNVPASGKVLIDGYDIKQATAASLYDQMAIVAQESLLFDTTVRENIRAGRLDATDEEVEAAARKAEIHDAILAMPNGYDTRVGERGSALSGGQRQRIAIARAVLRDPRILVLDEATSALDPATEQAVSKTLDQLGRGRTIVSVTHRLQTVLDYDMIFVMKDGVLVESGSHAALVAKGGEYRALWDKQSGVTVTADGSEATVAPALLAQMPAFASLSEATRAELAHRFATMRFPEGHLLFAAGDPGDAFYVVAHGQVSIEVPAQHGRAPRTTVCTVGDCFGEIALLGSRPRTATARTRTPCTLLVLTRQHFHELVAREPQAAGELQRKAERHLSADLTGEPSA